MDFIYACIHSFLNLPLSHHSSAFKVTCIAPQLHLSPFVLTTTLSGASDRERKSDWPKSLMAECALAFSPLHHTRSLKVNVFLHYFWNKCRNEKTVPLHLWKRRDLPMSNIGPWCAKLLAKAVAGLSFAGCFPHSKTFAAVVLENVPLKLCTKCTVLLNWVQDVMNRAMK